MKWAESGLLGAARGSREGAVREDERARGSTIGQCRGTVGRSLNWQPPVSAIPATFTFLYSALGDCSLHMKISSAGRR